MLLIPSSWGSQLGALTPHHQAFFWRRCQRERRFLQGESLTLNLLLCFFLLYFILLISFYQKYKKLVPTIVVIFVGLLLSCFIMLSINGWFL
jgi:hypothetical protein